MPLFQLLRIPGVFTALADILAGYLIVRFSGAGAGRADTLPFILAASACLYMAGMAWNDIFDLEEDRQTRPERPLPSGVISLAAAFMIAAVLSIAGLMLSTRAGLTSFLTAAALLVLILLYNAGLKRVEILGPLAMGGCRGINLFLGMTAHPEVLALIGDYLLLVPALLLLAYTTVLTTMATMEAPPPHQELLPAAGEGESASATPGTLDSGVRDSEMGTQPEAASPPVFLRQHMSGQAGQAKAEAAPSVTRVESSPGGSRLPEEQPDPIVMSLGAVALALVPVAAWWLLPDRPLATGIFALLLAFLAIRLRRAIREGSRQGVRALVGGGIMGIVLLDAGMVASLTSAIPRTMQGLRLYTPTREELAGVALVAVMLLPAWVLRRRFAVT